MPLSSWLCTSNSKNLLVRIVHPGGHVELHDSPVLAGEIMFRNPRCCVAYPHVFQQPWAILEPDTMLMLGHRYYVVPMSTIRKLQRLTTSPRYSPSPGHELRNSSPSPVYEIKNTQSSNEKEDEGMIPSCCFFPNFNTHKQPLNCMDHSRDKREKSESRTDANVNDLTKEKRTSRSSGSSETKTPTKKKIQDFAGNGMRCSPKGLWSSDHWQPSLDSITEE
ncbi:hypothetical protein L6164_004540 [Bauhinia variegata]|uniref:Uncharacterized protein n=1 Tax=Bauhinia variegata TaxID=167791 RepID=A0ACB9Q7G4_BAUVA|nr:hypothetical protein L6164_004540 [Bauhinia variegata]